MCIRDRGSIFIRRPDSFQFIASGAATAVLELFQITAYAENTNQYQCYTDDRVYPGAIHRYLLSKLVPTNYQLVLTNWIVTLLSTLVNEE